MSTTWAVSRPRARKRRGGFAAMAAALIIYGTFCAPATAMQGAGTGVSGASVLEAADHAELSAEISASGVVRIALEGDRIVRAVRSTGRFEIEHEPANGDLYLRPLGVAGGGAGQTAEVSKAAEAAPTAGPVVLAPAVLFVGTEKGFTYRLTLVPVAGGPVQVLIRNTAAGRPARASADARHECPRIGTLVRLVHAVARREPLAGYAINAGGSFPGLTVIETWRGSRFAAFVFEAAPSAFEGAEGTASLAGTMGGLPGVGGTGDGARVAALWLAAPGTGPSGGRLAVAVVEDAPTANLRHAGDVR